MPAAGTNQRRTDFGSVEIFGRGRVEVLVRNAGLGRLPPLLEALDARHAATGHGIFLVLDNGPCYRSQASRAALAERAVWLHVIWLACDSPHLNRKAREWQSLKCGVHSHLAHSLRDVADEILAGHRRPPRWPPRRPPNGAKDTRPWAPRRSNLPAPT